MSSAWLEQHPPVLSNESNIDKMQSNKKLNFANQIKLLQNQLSETKTHESDEAENRLPKTSNKLNLLKPLNEGRLCHPSDRLTSTFSTSHACTRTNTH